MKLRISTRDSRCSFGQPIALEDVESGELISCHRSLADGMRARVLLDQLAPFARDFLAEELSELAATTCERIFGHDEPERLSLSKFNSLTSAIRTELRARRATLKREIDMQEARYNFTPSGLSTSGRGVSPSSAFYGVRAVL
jgi:hypothetical protein